VSPGLRRHQSLNLKRRHRFQKVHTIQDLHALSIVAERGRRPPGKLLDLAKL
jgi:hypothetical protein